MTVFITPCWKRCLERACLLLGGLLCLATAWASGIEPRHASLVPDDHAYALTAQFDTALGPRLVDAVERGVTLHFRLEFTLARKRWYWTDEHLAGQVIDYRLGFQALTRQYRLSRGGLHQNFDSLDEALKALGRVGRLRVAERVTLTPGETHVAAVRLSLDHGQLPKPLQVDALADRDWRVEAKTLRWEFVPPLPAADK